MFVLVVGLVAEQLGRIFALGVLVIELRRCGVKSWETWVVTAFLAATLGLIAATAAVGLGEVRYVSL